MDDRDWDEAEFHVILYWLITYASNAFSELKNGPGDI